MPARPQSDGKSASKRSTPATTPKDREDRMIALALNLAEKRMRQGSASAQEVTHFLKLGSSREQLEQERLSGEVLLLQAKIESLESQKDIQALYKEAMEAMSSYKGHSTASDEDA